MPFIFDTSIWNYRKGRWGYHHLPVWGIWKIYVDFRCTKVHNDFLIAVGSSSGFWFVGRVFYILVLSLGVWIFCFLPSLVDHAVLLMFDVAGIIKAALGWFYSFPSSLSLVCICCLGSRKSKDFASFHLSEDSCALQDFGEAFAGFCGWVLNQQLVLQYVREWVRTVCFWGLHRARSSKAAAVDWALLPQSLPLWYPS